MSIIVSAYRFHLAGIEVRWESPEVAQISPCGGCRLSKAWLHVPVKKAKAENEVRSDIHSLEKLVPYIKECSTQSAPPHRKLQEA
eukprot:5548379-Amphidinium_carterae.1